MGNSIITTASMKGFCWFSMCSSVEECMLQIISSVMLNLESILMNPP